MSQKQEDIVSSQSEHMPVQGTLEGAATKPKDDSLYQELLRYHGEEDSTQSSQEHADVQSIRSEDDRKPPAKPRAQILPGRSSVYSEETSVSYARPRLEEVPSAGNEDCPTPKSHGNSPPFAVTQEGPNLGPTSLPSAYKEHAAPHRSRIEHDHASNVTPLHNKALSFPGRYHQYEHDEYHLGYSHNVTSKEDMSSPPKLQRDKHVYRDSMVAVGHSEVLSPAGIETSSNPESRRTPPRTLSRQSHSPHNASSHAPLMKMGSFYESALQASGQVSPNSYDPDRLAKDEQLARELARRLELEDALRNQPPPEPATDPEQMKILEKIREEADRKQLEVALRESGVSLGGTAEYVQRRPARQPNAETERVDFLLSQQIAMEEWRQIPRPPMRRTSSDRPLSEVPYRVSMDHYTPHSLENGRPTPSSHRSISYTAPEYKQGSENPLLQRGSLETQEAIANGRAHVVQCQGCLGRLHAPMSYALVYCPKCHTVSPGQTYLARDNRAGLRQSRSKHSTANNSKL